jgi:hypothetical protein
LATEMIRKMLNYGRAKAITVPGQWIRYQERKHKKRLTKLRVVTHEDRFEVYPMFTAYDPRLDYSPEDESSGPELPKFEAEEEDEEEEETAFPRGEQVAGH